MNRDNYDRLKKINEAFGEMYFAIYSIDIESDTYMELSTLDIFKEYIPPIGNINTLLDSVVNHYVTNVYQKNVKEFLDLNTIQDRLKEDNAISIEFIGITQGWCRASLVVENRDSNGKVLQIVYVTQEINNEKKKELTRLENLNKAYIELENANRAKSDFLFKISHDIRTPLNAILGFNELIGNNLDDPIKIKEYVEKIKISGNMLLSLMNEVLDMTKIEMGDIALNNIVFDINELIDNLKLVITPQIELKDQTLIIEKNITHSMVKGDSIRINRILFNILNNAIKYTQNGGNIVFKIYESNNDDKYINYNFIIEDNGIGIANDSLESIFNIFYREDNKNVKSIEGTGLGLSIAKNFITAMNGSIEVESVVNEGSTFKVELPLKIINDSSKEKDVYNNENPLDGLNILLVEDNEFNAQITQELLEYAHANSTLATNGKEAIELFNHSNIGDYDIILMDVRMPLMNGYEVSKAIRALDREDAPIVPIIALTANTFKEDIEKAYDSGMNAHISKPLNMIVLKKVVKDLTKSV